MASMPEKCTFRLRSLSGLIAASVFFVILSSSLLFHFGDNPFVPISIYKLVLVNYTSNQTIEPEPRPEVVEPVASCDHTPARLKVFMYDLPPEFHFGLLGWRGNPNQIWPKVDNFSEIPSYPGGLNLQHSPEYWLTLDLLSSLAPNVARPCTAVLVPNSTQADVVFVPFFSSLSYNRHSNVRGKERNAAVDRVLQERLVAYLTGAAEWKRFGGRDHVIVAHHPNSMLVARKKLGSARFVLADFGRYPARIANLEKDVVAPYKHLVRTVDDGGSRPFEARPVLAYFQGAIYRKDGGWVRRKLYQLMKDESDVHFAFGSVRGGGVREAARGMAASKFCLHLAGDTPSSNRLFDAIASRCVPVVISDDVELPFEDVLDYATFAVFVRASDASQKGYLLRRLRGVRKRKWTEMWRNLKRVAVHFEYGYPSRPGDAVDMIWQAVSRKVSRVRYEVHRKNRYQMSQNFLRSRELL